MAHKKMSLVENLCICINCSDNHLFVQKKKKREGYIKEKRTIRVKAFSQV